MLYVRNILLWIEFHCPSTSSHFSECLNCIPDMWIVVPTSDLITLSNHSVYRYMNTDVKSEPNRGNNCTVAAVYKWAGQALKMINQFCVMSYPCSPLKLGQYDWLPKSKPVMCPWPQTVFTLKICNCCLKIIKFLLISLVFLKLISLNIP